MKKLGKSLILVICLIALVGCNLKNDTASDAVALFLDQYQSLSTAVLADLENVVKHEDLTDEQKEKYRDILKKEYSDLKYEIKKEEYHNDKAIVYVKLTVYDLYKVQKEAAQYLNNNIEEFQDENGNYDEKKYMDYKLDKMQKLTDTTSYDVEIEVSKDEDGKWHVDELSDETLEKIHGIYNYDGE